MIPTLTRLQSGTQLGDSHRMNGFIFSSRPTPRPDSPRVHPSRPLVDGLWGETRPILKPLALELQREELRARVERNRAAHLVNQAAAFAAGEMEGVRIADAGIARCDAVLALLRSQERRAA